MKVKLGIRGSSDAVNAIIIKLDDLMLVTADNLFLSGQESRTNTGKSLVSLLESLSCVDNQIEIGDKLIPMIESELHIEEGTLNKFIIEKEQITCVEVTTMQVMRMGFAMNDKHKYTQMKIRNTEQKNYAQ